MLGAGWASIVNQSVLVILLGFAGLDFGAVRYRVNLNGNIARLRIMGSTLGLFGFAFMRGIVPKSQQPTKTPTKSGGGGGS
jgi:hypothetical protein